MKVSLNRINDNYLFEAKGASGVPVLIDNKTDEPSKGASKTLRVHARNHFFGR